MRRALPNFLRRKKNRVAPIAEWKKVGGTRTKEFEAPKFGVPHHQRRRLNTANFDEHFVGRRDPYNKAMRKRIEKRRAKNKVARKTRKKQRS